MLELLELGPDGPVVKVYGKSRLRVFVLSANFEPNVARITIVHAHVNFWTSTKVKYMQLWVNVQSKITTPFSDSFGGSLKISVVMPSLNENGFGNELCAPFDLASQHFKCQVARSL